MLVSQIAVVGILHVLLGSIAPTLWTSKLWLFGGVGVKKTHGCLEREKSTKHKYSDGIVPRLGGGQKVVAVVPFKFDVV